ncbi:uncharacterized protein LOC144132868 [Amblyomma americanum]
MFSYERVRPPPSFISIPLSLQSSEEPLALRGAEKLVIMAPVKILVGILTVGLGITAAELETEECDFSGIDLDKEVDKIVSMLPKTYHAGGPEDFTPIFTGLDVAGVQATGIDKIKRYGPVVPYCFKGTAMAHMDFINDGDVQLTAPWRLCSGQKGKVSLRAEYSRFTVHLRLRSRNAGEKYLAMTSEYPIMPVETYGAAIIVEGVSDGVKIASSILSSLFPSIPLKLWIENFFPNFREALRYAVEGSREVF